MESNLRNDYIHKVNLTLKNKLKNKQLISGNNNNSNKNKPRVKNTVRNNKINKPINNSVINRISSKEILNIKNEKQNYSRNIKKDNSFCPYTPKVGLKRKIFKTLKTNKKYRKHMLNKINNDSESVNNNFTFEKENKNNKSCILKNNNASLRTESNESHSIFKQIISRFQKFNGKYKKFIKHTTESYTFNNNINPKPNDKNINIIINDDENNKNNSLKKETSENLKLKTIKVNHMNKVKTKYININSMMDKSLDKISGKNNKRNKEEIEGKNIIMDNISKDKEQNIFVNNNAIFENEINDRKSVNSKFENSNIRIISYNTFNTIIKESSKNSINTIPRNYRVDSKKREMKKDVLFIKDKIPKNSNFKNIKVRNRSKKINKNSGLLIEKNSFTFNKTSLLRKKNNSYKRNNNYIYINKNEDKNNFTMQKDIQHEENSYFYNHDSILNNNNFPRYTISEEYENQNQNLLKQNYVKDNDIFNIEKTPNIEKLNNRIYINTINSQSNKDSFENNDSFFEGNQIKTQNNRIQKIGLYKKPIKSKSKNQNSGLYSSKEKLLYTKKNNLYNLTKTLSYKFNDSIEINSNYHDTIKYIRPKIQKNFYLYSNKNELNSNLYNQDNKKNMNINNDNNYNNEDSDNNNSFYIIKKDHTFNYIRKYYNYSLKFPIKKICFIDKIKTNKRRRELSNDLQNNTNEVKGNIINKTSNFFSNLIKNGKEDFKAKTINNFYNKLINKFKSENIYDNKFNFYSKTLMIKKPNQKSKKQVTKEEKFTLGYSKLDKIFSKKSEIQHVFNGLNIDSIKSINKNNSPENIKDKKEFYTSISNNKENGGKKRKYECINSTKLYSDQKSSRKSYNFDYNSKELFEKYEPSETIISNKLNFISNETNNNHISKASKIEEYFYNINQNKKTKNKKNSKSSSKLNNSDNSLDNKMVTIFNKDIYTEIKKDLENYLEFAEKEENTKYEINYTYNWKIIDDLMMNGKTKLEDIIQIYIEICKNRKISKDELIKINNYIKTIIEYYISDFSKNQIEIVHLNMIELFKSIIEYISNSPEIFFEILGNLFYILLKNKLYFMKDLNTFIGYSREIQINIAKFVRYSILASGKNLKQYHNDFKFTKLFNNNEIFVNYVTKKIFELK